jgi:hypothetical protein
LDLGPLLLASYDERYDDMTAKKKIFWITTLIIIAAIAIVLFVGYINKQPSEYDGTLVKSYEGFPIILEFS